MMGTLVVGMDELADDLAAESADLDRIIDHADDLTVATPAPPWSVADQVSHLWYFDVQAMLALHQPDEFAKGVDRLLADGTDVSVALGRRASRDELLARWRTDRRRLVETSRHLDPKQRVPWYGPSMGARSFVTARLMETWAHGQDIVDGLEVEREPTDRLRHVAEIGVRARPFAYTVNERPLPEAPVRVTLAAPGGGEWGWGPDGATDSIIGPALDFCLVVTRRRHPDDVGLTLDGPAAHEWMTIAQAFAGPPGPGRRPGQFGPIGG